MADYSQRQYSTVLHALAVGTFKGDAAADARVVFLWRLLIRYRCTASVVGHVPLQDVTSADHHASCLERKREWGGESSCCHFFHICEDFWSFWMKKQGRAVDLRHGPQMRLHLDLAWKTDTQFWVMAFGRINVVSPSFRGKFLKSLLLLN